jgi:UPF0716 protein FxsA
MFALLAAVFIVFSLVEIYVLVTVGQAIGALNTIALVIIIALIGAWLAKHEGASVLRRIQNQLNAGKMPNNELIDGGLILTGAILLITPGFVTDIIGIFFLLPPTRAVIRTIVRRRFNLKVAGVVGIPPGFQNPGFQGPGFEGPGFQGPGSGPTPGSRPYDGPDDIIDL